MATTVAKYGFSQTQNFSYFNHFGAALKTPNNTFGFHQKAERETSFATQASKVRSMLLSPIGSVSNACTIVRRPPDRRFTLPLLCGGLNVVIASDDKQLGQDPHMAYSPEERAKQKAAARARDEERLASGEISAANLQLENAHIARRLRSKSDTFVIRLS
ncbi:hypothetical protein, partial [Celeribacter sp.]|uniref:hypothetical protein n=1 Tax=Celeribacter sp. TaxID=1890673 RepID=UPI003A9579F4